MASNMGSGVKTQATPGSIQVFPDHKKLSSHLMAMSQSIQILNAQVVEYKQLLDASNAIAVCSQHVEETDDDSKIAEGVPPGGLSSGPSRHELRSRVESLETDLEAEQKTRFDREQKVQELALDLEKARGDADSLRNFNTRQEVLHKRVVIELNVKVKQLEVDLVQARDRAASLQAHVNELQDQAERDAALHRAMKERVVAVQLQLESARRANPDSAMKRPKSTSTQREVQDSETRRRPAKPPPLEHKLDSSARPSTPVAPPSPRTTSSPTSQHSKGTRTKSAYREFKLHAKTLSETKDPESWKRRLEAINAVKSLIENRGLLQLRSWPAIEGLFVRTLALQLADLRSAVSTAACGVVLSMAAALGPTERGVTLARSFLPHIYKMLYVSIRVVSSAGRNCILHVVKRCASLDLLPDLVEAATASTHPPVRRECMACVGTLLEALDPAIIVKSRGSMLSVSRAIVAGVSDGDPGVRQTSRNVFFTVLRAWPREAATIFASMSSDSQRAVKREQLAAERAASTGRKAHKIVGKRKKKKRHKYRHQSLQGPLSMGRIGNGMDRANQTWTHLVQSGKLTQTRSDSSPNLLAIRESDDEGIASAET